MTIARGVVPHHTVMMHHFTTNLRLSSRSYVPSSTSELMLTGRGCDSTYVHTKRRAVSTLSISSTMCFDYVLLFVLTCGKPKQQGNLTLRGGTRGYMRFSQVKFLTCLNQPFNLPCQHTVRVDTNSWVFRPQSEPALVSSDSRVIIRPPSLSLSLAHPHPCLFNAVQHTQTHTHTPGYTR